VRASNGALRVAGCGLRVRGSGFGVRGPWASGRGRAGLAQWHARHNLAQVCDKPREAGLSLSHLHLRTPTYPYVHLHTTTYTYTEPSVPVTFRSQPFTTFRSHLRTAALCALFSRKFRTKALPTPRDVWCHVHTRPASPLFARKLALSSEKSCSSRHLQTPLPEPRQRWHDSRTTSKRVARRTRPTPSAADGARVDGFPR